MRSGAWFGRPGGKLTRTAENIADDVAERTRRRRILPGCKRRRPMPYRNSTLVLAVTQKV
jgi:hypothetical protein